MCYNNLYMEQLCETVVMCDINPGYSLELPAISCKKHIFFQVLLAFAQILRPFYIIVELNNNKVKEYPSLSIMLLSVVTIFRVTYNLVI